MSRIARVILKILVALCLVLGTLVAVIGAYCYRYKDQIVQKFLDETNQRLGDSIRIRSAQLSFVKSFPNVSLILHDVAVKDRTDSATEVLTARKIFCVFDLWKFAQRQYVLDNFYLEHGKICFGEDPGSLLSQEPGVQVVLQTDVPLMVKLRKMSLKDMEVVYSGKKQHYVVHAAQVQASVGWDYSGLEANFQGKTTIRYMKLTDFSFAENLPISLKATLHYNRQEKTWTSQQTQLKHGDSLLVVRGSWGLGPRPSVALTIQGKRINLRTLLHYLPQPFRQKIKPYSLQGELALNASVRRQSGKRCALQGDFAWLHGSLTVSQLSAPILLSTLLGNVSIPDIQDLTTATLRIDKITGMLASSRLEGNLVLNDFRKLQLRCAAKSSLDLASLEMLLANAPMEDASGRLNIDGEFSANLKQLMRGACAKDNLSLSGVMQIQEAVQFRLSQSRILCKDLMGNFVFHDNELTVKDFSGSIGPGEFSLAGTVQNLLPCVLRGSQALCVNARLYMDYLDLDAVIFSKKAPTASIHSRPLGFDIPSQWALNLDCDIQQLHFRRFQGKHIRGKVKIKDKQLIAERLQSGVSGGKVFLDGVLDTNNDHITMRAAAKLEDVQIANLFYVFENFHQNFLTDSHLSGEVSSDVDLAMQADRQGNVRWDTLHATIDFRLINGALHNFGPLQRLAKYVEKGHLANLFFSELKNCILIKEKTIYIPPMEVHTNPTHIQISGTHRFDGKIDYSFGIPFSRSQQEGVRKVPGEASATAGPHLFFNLQGKIDDYQISHDVDASKKSLAKAVKAQGKVLKALAQGAYQEKNPPKELALDDYFEFGD